MLVLIVVLVFLQTWRATLIPMIAVPVSLVGTFAVMAAFGFSLNNLTLFGLVLAIGIVVDDAIVVVEAVEHNIEHGLDPKEATRKAMDTVGGAVVAIAIVLSAVFIPTAFISGITGQFYRQFALTIAVATLISAFNSLTLSPALAALLLKPRSAKKDLIARGLDLALGWFFRLFNKGFDAATNAYACGCAAPVAPGGSGPAGVRGVIGAHRFGLQDGAGRVHPDAGPGLPDRPGPVTRRRHPTTLGRNAPANGPAGLERARCQPHGRVHGLFRP